MERYFATGLCLLLLAACSDSNNTNVQQPEPPILPDFTEADAWMEEFVATEEAFPGGSYIVVDKNLGVVHKAAFGNQLEDSLVLLASTSKVPTVTLLMALHEDDDNVDFDMTAPIANYLPWQGVWDEAITTEHLVSNRSGIPGLLWVFVAEDLYRRTNASICLRAPCRPAPRPSTRLPCPDSRSTPPTPSLITAAVSGSCLAA